MDQNMKGSDAANKVGDALIDVVNAHAENDEDRPIMDHVIQLASDAALATLDALTPGHTAVGIVDAFAHMLYGYYKRRHQTAQPDGGSASAPTPATEDVAADKPIMVE